MRTIKFRGKSLLNKKWIYGCLIKHNSIVSKTSIVTESIAYYRDCFVIDKTVGQFTGLYDKNGREIYEGDIVDYKDGVLDDIYHDIEIINRGTILFSYGRFYVTNLNYVDMDDLISRDTNFDGEVIGNIHDTPELLKQQEL